MQQDFKRGSWRCCCAVHVKAAIPLIFWIRLSSGEHILQILISKVLRDVTRNVERAKNKNKCYLPLPQNLFVQRALCRGVLE